VEDNFMTEGLAPGPDGTLLRFHYDSSKNESASNGEGRPIFDTVLLVDVITPGQKSSTPTFEVERVWSLQSLQHMDGLTGSFKRSHHYKKFEDQIERFKRQDIPDMGGTPLKSWPRVDRGTIATLMAINIYTVEQLANVADTALDRIGMGARDLREQARSFLSVAEGTADISAFTAKISDLEVENRRLTEALALSNRQASDLQKQLAVYEAAKTLVAPAPVFKDI
jgi:hypothetical protein